MAVSVCTGPGEGVGHYLSLVAPVAAITFTYRVRDSRTAPGASWSPLPALPGGQWSPGLRVEQDSRREAVSEAAHALPTPGDLWSP